MTYYKFDVHRDGVDPTDTYAAVDIVARLIGREVPVRHVFTALRQPPRYWDGPLDRKEFVQRVKVACKLSGIAEHGGIDPMVAAVTQDFPGPEKPSVNNTYDDMGLPKHPEKLNRNYLAALPKHPDAKARSLKKQLSCIAERMDGGNDSEEEEDSKALLQQTTSTSTAVPKEEDEEAGNDFDDYWR